VLLGLGFVLVTLFAPKGIGGLFDPRQEGGPMSTLLEVSASPSRSTGSRRSTTCRSKSAKPELRAIIGPNGAGKTTFMDIVTGKTRPDEGTVRWGEMGHSLCSAVGKRRSRARVGRKFQRPTVFEDQSVRDNLRWR
jgi:urea transport system ATP-binding protein